MIELLKPSRGKDILEVGCGDARFCYELKKLPHRSIVGVDYSSASINFARAFNPELEFHVQNINALKLNKTFDGVVSLEVLGSQGIRYLI